MSGSRGLANSRKLSLRNRSSSTNTNTTTVSCTPQILKILSDYKKNLAQIAVDRYNEFKILHAELNGSTFDKELKNILAILKNTEIFTVNSITINTIITALNISSPKMLNSITKRWSTSASNRVSAHSLRTLINKVSRKETSVFKLNLKELYAKQIQKLTKISCLSNMNFVYISPIMINKAIDDIIAENMLFDEAKLSLNTENKQILKDNIDYADMIKRLHALQSN